jgi:hypothetical protein
MLRDMLNLPLYKTDCESCKNTYSGQTGQTFENRNKEHIRDIRHNGQSKIKRISDM